MCMSFLHVCGAARGGRSLNSYKLSQSSAISDSDRGETPASLLYRFGGGRFRRWFSAERFVFFNRSSRFGMFVWVVAFLFRLLIFF